MALKEGIEAERQRERKLEREKGKIVVRERRDEYNFQILLMFYARFWIFKVRSLEQSFEKYPFFVQNRPTHFQIRS